MNPSATVKLGPIHSCSVREHYYVTAYCQDVIYTQLTLCTLR